MEDISTFSRLLETLQHQPVLTFFLILGMGYLIGNIRIGSFSLGPVAGVLFVGLFLGHFGFEISPGAQSVGFAMFIFSVGYQAGPRFFQVLKTDGLKYFLLALVMNIVSVLGHSSLTKILERRLELVEDIGFGTEVTEMVVTLFGLLLHDRFHFSAVIAMKRIALDERRCNALAPEDLREHALHRGCAGARRTRDGNDWMRNAHGVTPLSLS